MKNQRISDELEFSDVYITHCGPNSAQLSILSLTPVVAIPGDSLERRSNANALKRLGLATILDEGDLSPQRILDVCEGYLRFSPTDEAKHWREFIQRCLGATEIPKIIACMDGVT
jgi:UDP:flavonoid glycosyltransferase YjiC (YdhE family)